MRRNKRINILVCILGLGPYFVAKYKSVSVRIARDQYSRFGRLKLIESRTQLLIFSTLIISTDQSEIMLDLTEFNALITLLFAVAVSAIIGIPGSISRTFPSS